MRKAGEKQGEINRADESVKGGGGERREHAHSAGVGNETHANMKGALGDAVDELHKQHPHEYHDHGPHHGTTTHIRHTPLHGLKPHGG